MTSVDAHVRTHGSQYLSVGPLEAHYSMGISDHTGNWVAIATIRCTLTRVTPPASLLIGIGPTEREAVNDLRREMRTRAQSLCPPPAAA